MSNLIYLIPMMIANAMPVVVRHIPYLGIPIYAPLLGANKTRRGLIAGIASATIVWYTMVYIGLTTGDMPFYIGWILGAGALLGDLIESAIKRHIGIPSGASLKPRDQIDYIIAGIIVSLPWIDRTII